MAMFLDGRKLGSSARQGEGVIVDPRPRRRRLTAAQDRLMIFAAWASFRRQGRSFKAIAGIVNRPIRTVRDGIAEYHTFVAGSKAILADDQSNDPQADA